MPTPAASRTVLVRSAAPHEHDAVGRLMQDVYVGGGFTAPDSPYVASLSSTAERAAAVPVLVAVDGSAADPDLPGPAAPALLGTVTYVPGPGPYGEVLRSDDEAEFRMLAVAGVARGRGVGTALVSECVARARRAGRRRLQISSQPTMTDAHRLYAGLGFRRTPERDWAPRPGLDLMTFGLDL